MRGQSRTSGAGWRCVEAAAGLLAPVEREVVLGDLAEMDRGAWSGLGDVLGLAVRRQLSLWRSWRPWAASFGLAMPASLFLMGWSVAASGAAISLLQERTEALVWVSLSRLLLVICWAWMAGFVVGSVARGTLWASVLVCCASCVHCLLLWPGHGISFLRLFVFLLPGACGVWWGRRELRVGLTSAVFLAAMTTLAPLTWGNGGWVYGCWLLWPGLYLTATARRKQE